MTTEQIQLKNNPLPGPRSMSGRYGLLSQQLLKQQTETAKLFGERWLSTREVAEALGGITLQTARGLMNSGQLPATRFGKNGWRRVRLSDVKAFIERSAVTHG